MLRRGAKSVFELFGYDGGPGGADDNTLLVLAGNDEVQAAFAEHELQDSEILHDLQLLDDDKYVEWERALIQPNPYHSVLS